MSRTQAGKETEVIIDEAQALSARGKFQQAHDNLITRAEATRTNYDSQILLSLVFASMADDYTKKALAEKVSRRRMSVLSTLRNQALRCSEAATSLSDTVAAPPYLAAKAAHELGLPGKAFEYVRISLKRSPVHTPSWELLAELYDGTSEQARAAGCRSNAEAIHNGNWQGINAAWAEPAATIAPQRYRA
jgi:hypothetical protein